MNVYLIWGFDFPVLQPPWFILTLFTNRFVLCFFFFGFCSWFQSFSVNSFHFKVDCFKTGTGKWGVHAKGTQQQKMDIAKPRSKNSPTNTYTRSYFPVEHPSIFWRCQSREWTKEVLLCGSGWFVAPTC